MGERAPQLRVFRLRHQPPAAFGEVHGRLVVTELEAAVHGVVQSLRADGGGLQPQLAVVADRAPCKGGIAESGELVGARRVPPAALRRRQVEVGAFGRCRALQSIGIDVGLREIARDGVSRFETLGHRPLWDRDPAGMGDQSPSQSRIERSCRDEQGEHRRVAPPQHGRNEFLVGGSASSSSAISITVPWGWQSLAQSVSSSVAPWASRWVRPTA